MKTKLPILLAALCALALAGCSTVSTKRIDAAPVLAAQHTKDATITAKADTIAEANATIAKAAPAVAPQTAVIAAAVTDIKAAVAAAPAAQVDKLVGAQQKVVDKQAKQIASMQDDHALVVWLYVGFVVFALAAVACGFFASYVEEIPLIGALLGKIIGPVFAGVLGALSATCYVLARFIVWTHEHPWIFGSLVLLGGIAAGIGLVNKYDHALFEKLESDATAAITALKAKLGISSPVPAPVAPAPAAAPIAPVSTP